MTDEQDVYFMEKAIELSELALSKGQAPFGAVVVNLEGNIVGSGHNTAKADLDVSAHGEVMALRDACRRMGHYNLKGFTVYTSTEPCLACSLFITQLEIGRVVYAAQGTDVPGFKPPLGADFEEVARWINAQPDWPPIEVKGELMREQAVEILMKYFKR